MVRWDVGFGWQLFTTEAGGLQLVANYPSCIHPRGNLDGESLQRLNGFISWTSVGLVSPLLFSGNLCKSGILMILIFMDFHWSSNICGIIKHWQSCISFCFVKVREEQSSTENTRGPGFVKAWIQATLVSHSRRVVGPAPSTYCRLLIAWRRNSVGKFYAQ